MSDKQLEVLLVEDSPEDVFFFERALKRSGRGNEVKLSIVTDGGMAVEFLERNGYRPDLIFLDLKLPRLSGFDVLRWIRQQDFSPSLRVIVLSGSSHEKDQALASELGAVDYVVKPISPQTLAKLLQVEKPQIDTGSHR